MTDATTLTKNHRNRIEERKGDDLAQSPQKSKKSLHGPRQGAQARSEAVGDRVRDLVQGDPDTAGLRPRAVVGLKSG